jgi:hypothetical protein
VSIAICQKRRLEPAAPAISALKNRCPLTRLILKPVTRIYASDNCLLSQRQKAFTSVALLIPALFASIVAKKPHIPLKGGRLAGWVGTISGGLPVGGPCHYIGGEPFSGVINDIQGYREV